MSRILSGISLGLLCLTTLARADDVQRMIQTDGNTKPWEDNFDSLDAGPFLDDLAILPDPYLASMAPDTAADASRDSANITSGLNSSGDEAAASCGDCYDPCCTICRRGRLRDRLLDGNPCFGWRFPCNHYGDPWRLFHSYNQAWSFGGWVEAGVTTNSDGAFLNGPLAFPSTNELLMNQLWFFAERKANTGGYGWDWGLRLDYIFGTDGPDTQAFGDGGWDFGWNSGGVTIPEHTYGSAIPQLYLEVAYNDVTVKLGRFYTIIGYEAVQAPENFFYSHAYTMDYAEPFTHTGALVEWAWNEETMLYGGYVAGWDTGWENPTGAHMFLGGISLARWDNAVLTYALTAGDMGVGGNRGQGDLYMHSIVLEYQLTDAWEYVFQSDFAAATNSTSQGENVHAYGINQYLFYEINNCWALGFRFEWFNAEDGHVVNNYDDPGDYYALTAGLNYRPNPNLTIRPEIRADWFDATNPGATLPFANNTSDDQFSAAIDFIFTF